MAGRPKKKPEYNQELQFNHFLQEQVQLLQETPSEENLWQADISRIENGTRNPSLSMELHIRNIAEIEKADIEINGITVIAGENNTGKSIVTYYCGCKSCML